MRATSSTRSASARAGASSSWIAKTRAAAGSIMDGRQVVAALALAFASWSVSIVGAGAWPGLGEAEVMDEARFTAVEFPRTAVDDVTVGVGWSNGGILTAGLIITTDRYKAAVVGDTVGDPFKDTSGPGVAILIKVMSVVSLLVAPLIATF